MKDDLFQRAMRLFDEACRLDAAEQAAFLDRACAGDEALRREVQELLAFDAGDAGRTFTAGGGARLLAAKLDQGAPDASAAATPASVRALRPAAAAPSLPALNYRIIGKIGEGGMGEVFEAEQSVPRRRVAIKVMRPGLSSARALRRFEHEAHVLGRLRHPGIAQIYEVGAISADRPDDAFFAMELVDGLPLDQFAERNHLDVHARLELVARICDAIQHAHQRGVIHRDLKPANILVEPAGQPKILDFGVARVASDDELLTRQLTSAGQIVGTLAYMAPEQVGSDPAQIDVRCDVYALGVILYQLLARRLPIDPGSRPIAEALRMIREADPPTLGSLDRALRGDIETVVLKAMEKEPGRRYQSAAALADDLRRVLAGHPIEARPHSALYVARKFLRRHPVMTVAASLLAMGATAFTVHARWQAERFREMAETERLLRTRVGEAKEESDRLRTIADQTSERLAAKLRESDIERGRLFARTGNVGHAERLLWPAFLRDPNALPVRFGLREAYRREGLLATIQVAASPLTALSATPQGLLLVGDESGGVHLVDPATGSVRARTDLGSAVVVLDADPGPTVAAVCGDRSLRLLDPATLATVAQAPVEAARAVAISPDGRRVAVACADRRVRVLGLPDLAQTWVSDAVAPIHMLDWKPDGRELAGSSEGPVYIWSPERDRTAPVVTLVDHEGGVATVRWTPDGQRLLTGSSDRTVRLWSRQAESQQARWRFANGTLRHIALADDGGTAVVAGWWAIDRIDAATGVRLASATPSIGATGLALLGGADGRDGALAASVHPDGCVRVWSFAADRDRRTLPSVVGPARCAAGRLSDTMLGAIGGGDGAVVVRDLTTGDQVGRSLAIDGPVRALRFALDDQVLIVLSTDGVLRTVRRADGAVLASMSGADGTLSSVLDVSPDGALAAVAMPGGVLRVLRCLDLSIEREAPLDVGSLTGLSFAPRGGGCAAVGRRRIVTLRDDHLSEVARSADPVGTPWSPAFSPDGVLLASGTWGEAVQLWTLPDLVPAAALVGHRALAWLVRFHPTDSRLLHSAGEDGMLNLWDVSLATASTGTLLSTLRPFPASDVSGLALSPDGRLALVTSSLGEAAILDLELDDVAIAGNLEAAIARFGEGTSAQEVEAARAWSDGVRDREGQVQRGRGTRARGSAR